VLVRAVDKVNAGGEPVGALTLTDPPAETTHWTAAMMANADGAAQHPLTSDTEVIPQLIRQLIAARASAKGRAGMSQEASAPSRPDAACCSGDKGWRKCMFRSCTRMLERVHRLRARSPTNITPPRVSMRRDIDGGCQWTSVSSTKCIRG